MAKVKMETPDQLASELCKLEGLKKQVNRAQMKEILGKVADMIHTVPGTLAVIFKLGTKRAKKK